MTLENTCSVFVQDRSPEFILQIMQTADRINMPKTLACCERHVAIDPAKSVRTQAFWELISGGNDAQLLVHSVPRYTQV